MRAEGRRDRRAVLVNQLNMRLWPNLTNLFSKLIYNIIFFFNLLLEMTKKNNNTNPCWRLRNCFKKKYFFHESWRKLSRTFNGRERKSCSFFQLMNNWDWSGKWKITLFFKRVWRHHVLRHLKHDTSFALDVRHFVLLQNNIT